MLQGDPEKHIDFLERTRPEKPKPYKVLLENDPGTNGHLVNDILQDVFRLPGARAWDVLMSAHRSGVGLVGVYAKEVAETLASQANGKLTEEGYPGLFSIEEDE